MYYRNAKQANFRKSEEKRKNMLQKIRFDKKKSPIWNSQFSDDYLSSLHIVLGYQAIAVVEINILPADGRKCFTWLHPYSFTMVHTVVIYHAGILLKVEN